VLYTLLAAMLLAAILVIALPLYRQQRRLSRSSAAAIVMVLLISISVYSRIGTPDADIPQAGAGSSIEDMVSSLAQRLEQHPDDLNGWKMLGRSYVQTGNFPGAIAAFERAVEMEGGRNGNTLADLGEVILMSDHRRPSDRASQLFENALALAPDNQKALFYGGMAAIERGDKELGATRWERLLANSPPENIRQILRQQIAELRGAAPPDVTTSSGSVVTVSVSLGEAAAVAVQPGSTVFIIARDPAQPSPPIAAVRRLVSELPADVAIGDSDAMIPGRVPSAFSQLEIVARVSMSGQPIAQSGDWFGQQILSITESSEVTIIIDEQVP
jgi:cytochrome c-type biogenesis protein CcmH